MKLLASIIDLVDIDKHRSSSIKHECIKWMKVYVWWWKRKIWNVERKFVLYARVSKLQKFCILWSFKFLAIAFITKPRKEDYKQKFWMLRFDKQKRGLLETYNVSFYFGFNNLIFHLKESWLWCVQIFDLHLVIYCILIVSNYMIHEFEIQTKNVFVSTY